MKSVTLIISVIFIFAACGGSTSSDIAGEPSLPLAGNSQGVAGAEVSAELVLGGGENSVVARQSPSFRIIFNEDGTVAGMGGVDFNPCFAKSCVPKEDLVETPEIKLRTSLDWNRVKKD
ncbi:MAG: hypothetical protein COV46_06295 [Deltaproteobacteria bacterium CG11_big_fil_rev_8_21_14_0_20_49_13]|nr:MAG: hypothetical protein COV46_06295 [Deltaproteobacteria bacterium CG11_big_fil_rev_8_21_14_0_20_49_13]